MADSPTSDFDTFNPFGGLSGAPIATGGNNDFDTFAKPYVPPAPVLPVLPDVGGQWNGGPLTIDILKPMFVAQESSGDYTAVNAETGALGRYQVMPETGAALAKRLGLPWNPQLMRLNTVSGRAYQDQIGARAIQDSIDAGGGDPRRIFSHYYSGKADAYAKPGNPRTAQYVRDMMGRLTGAKATPAAPQPKAAGGFTPPPPSDAQGGFNTGSPSQGGFRRTAKPKTQGGFNTGAVSGIQSGIASAIKAFGSAADFLSSDPESFAAAQGGNVFVPPTGPGKSNSIASKTLQPIVTGMEQRAARSAPKDPNLAQRVIGGATGMVPALAAGVVNPLAMAGIFAQQSYDETYHEATQAGLSPEKARKAAAIAAALAGTLGMVPGEAVATKISGAVAKKFGIKGATGTVGKIVQRGVTRAAGNAGVMGTMKASSNVVAKTNYDPDRPIMEGVGEAALEGALAGELIHGSMRGGSKAYTTAVDVVKSARTGKPSAEAPATEVMPVTDATQNYRAGTETPVSEMSRAPVKPVFEVGDSVRVAKGAEPVKITEFSKSGKSVKVEGGDKWVPITRLRADEYLDPMTGRPISHGAEEAARAGKVVMETPEAELALTAHEAARPVDMKEPTDVRAVAEEADVAPLREAAQETHKELTQRLQEVGLDQTVALRIVDSLDGPQGSYHDGVIKVAMDHPDTLDTMNHEVLHAVREAITEKEWAALTREVDLNPAIKASVERRYPDLTPPEKVEEGVADLLKWYAKGVREYPKGAIAAAFQRIRDIFAQLGNVLRGRGFHTAESVLRAIDRGKIGGRVTEGRYTESPMLQAAYHGSPHDFERFSDEAIGTGEGAQSFGHGHYFAGKKEVAEYYRNTLSRDTHVKVTVNGKRQSMLSHSTAKIVEAIGLKGDDGQPFKASYVGQYIIDEMVRGKSLGEAIKVAREDYAHYPKEVVEKAIKAVRAAAPEVGAPKGKLYEVEIPEEHEYLDLDKRMDDQSSHVQHAMVDAGLLKSQEQIEIMDAGIYRLQRERITKGHTDEREYWRRVRERDDAVVDWSSNGRQFYDRLSERLADENGQRDAPEGNGWQVANPSAHRNDRLASEALKEAGIAGNRYKDAMSRDKDGGTSNYVVFDPARAEIKAKYSRAEDDTKRLREQAREMGINPDSIPALRELQELNKFHASFSEQVRARTEATRQLYNEVIPKLREAGKLPFDVGTRFTTTKSRELGAPPWKVVGYYLDPKDLQKYGYRVERGSRERDDFEAAQMLVNDPKGDASPYRAPGWDRAKEVASWQPLGGLSAVKFSMPDAIHEVAPHIERVEVFETPDKELYVRTPPGYVHDAKMIDALAPYGARPTNTYPRKGDRVLSEEEVSGLGRPEQGGDLRGRDRGREAAPLEGAPDIEGARGPDLAVTAIAHEYARSIGVDLKRQAEFVKVDPERAKRIADAYEAMEHAPNDPVVHEAYQNLIRQTEAQYRALEKAGYKFYFYTGADDPRAVNPWDTMRELRKSKTMGVFPTHEGFGSKATEIDVSANPLLAETGLRWPVGSPDSEVTKPVTANDMFRAVHDVFGHGIEGAGFRARGEENAWQAHARLFNGSALGALTSETRGQNSWLNYGPHGEANRTAKTEDTVFADQKTGLMPEWTWLEGRAGDMEMSHGQAAAERLGSPDRVRSMGGEGGDVGAAPDVRQPHERPPAQEDGTVKLDHWTATPGLTRTDPAEWGKSGRFLPIEERSRKGSAPGRTYFGIASGEPGGYVVEKFPGAKRERVEASVPLDQLYDMAADPDGLRAVGRALPRDERGRYEYKGKWIDTFSLYENLIKDAGYKGYWIKNPNLGLTAAVYEPVDVSKPKFSRPDDDLGRPDENLIGRSIMNILTRTDDVAARDSAEAIGGKLDDLRVEFQDKMLPVLRAQDVAARTLGRDIADSENPYLREELMTGRIGARLEQMVDGLVDPLFVSMKNEGVTAKELGDYLYARHAVERNAQIAKINPEFPDGGSGMTNAAAESIMNSARASGKGEAFDALARMTDKITREAMRVRVEGGLLSQKDADLWMSTYKHYVPLRGHADVGVEGSERIRQQSGASVRGPESKRALGRETEADNPLAYAILQLEEAIIRAEKNRVAQSFYELAKANKDPSLWTINKPNRKRRINKDTGLVEVYTSPNISAENKDFTVSAKFDGSERRVVLNRDNPFAVKVAQAIRNLDGPQFGKVMSMASWLNQQFSAINTRYNPAFVVTNAVRDVQTMAVVLQQHEKAMPGIAGRVMRDYFSAMTALDKSEGPWGKWRREWEQAGGKVYYNQAPDLATIKRDLAARVKRMDKPSRMGDAWRSVFDALEAMNESVERAVRLSVFKNAREMGASPDKAASMARNVTVNFTRKGKWGPAINSFYAFFNASTQGSTNLVLAAARSPRVRKAMLAFVAAGFLSDLINSMTSGNDADGESFWDKLPDHEKSRNAILMFPGDDSGRGIKLPLAYGLNVLFGLGRNASAALRGAITPGEAALASALEAADAFNPVGNSGGWLNVAAPTMADPFVDVTLNSDFTGRPIQPQQNPFDSDVTPSENFFPSASAWSKGTARAINAATGGDRVVPGKVSVSPEVIEYFFGFVTGGAGRFIGDVAKLVTAPLDPEADDVTVRDIPVVKSLATRKPEWVDKSRFYERAKLVDTVWDRTKRYRDRGDHEGAKRYADENRAIFQMRGQAKGANRTLSIIRKVRNTAVFGHEMGRIDNAQYRAALTAAKQREDRVIADFNRAWVSRVEKKRAAE